VSRWRREWWTAIRSALAFERLPPPPTAAEGAPRRGGLVRSLFAPEALPSAPVHDPPPARRRRLSSALFGAETLGTAPPRPRARSSPWLRWLLAVERLDPPSE
jgi:hypothetical protein